MNDDLEVQPGLVIAGHELEWSFVAAGGPGGQHANRSNTKAVLRFDIGASTSLTEAQRDRLLRKLPRTIVLEVDAQRSQLQNRRVARERLQERLVKALHRPKARRPTKPSKRAKQRRVTAKRQRSEVKRNRRRPTDND